MSSLKEKNIRLPSGFHPDNGLQSGKVEPTFVDKKAGFLRTKLSAAETREIYYAQHGKVNSAWSHDTSYGTPEVYIHIFNGDWIAEINTGDSVVGYNELISITFFDPKRANAEHPIAWFSYVNGTLNDFGVNSHVGRLPNRRAVNSRGLWDIQRAGGRFMWGEVLKRNGYGEENSSYREYLEKNVPITERIIELPNGDEVEVIEIEEEIPGKNMRRVLSARKSIDSGAIIEKSRQATHRDEQTGKLISPWMTVIRDVGVSMGYQQLTKKGDHAEDVILDAVS